LTKAYYFSVATSPYNKGKNINFYYNKDDCGTDDKQYFLATVHGKGACDKVWGTTKRLAR
jgi:hypothetical protein